jgi:hypothetical protein
MSTMASVPNAFAMRPHLGVVHLAADVGQVRAPHGGRVEVDPEVAVLDDLLEEDVGDARRRVAEVSPGKWRLRSVRSGR